MKKDEYEKLRADVPEAMMEAWESSGTPRFVAAAKLIRELDVHFTGDVSIHVAFSIALKNLDQSGAALLTESLRKDDDTPTAALLVVKGVPETGEILDAVFAVSNAWHEPQEPTNPQQPLVMFPCPKCKTEWPEEVMAKSCCGYGD